MAVSTIDALYNGTSEKLTTSATGITVTGTVAATAYTGDGSALTGTGSPSIDDNGVATVITIDSSDRVLTDTTNISAIAQTGNAMTYDNGRLEVQKYRASALRVGNYTDAFGAFSGDLIEFYTGGTTVGSIQSRGGTVSTLILDPRTNGGGLTGTANAVMPTSNAGVIGDANTSLDLGASGYAFRNAYLSGGVYLGGTGAANKLDDYEEGTWTPVLVDTSSTPTFYNNLARYTKIGRVVTLTFFQQTNANPQFSVAGSSFKITGIPFAVLGSGYTGSQGFMNCQSFDFNGSNNTANISGQVSPAVISTHDELRFVVSGSGQTRGEVKNSGAASGYIIEATIIYYTDA